MQPYVAIACGGAAGACARYWLSGLIYARLGATFPWGTFVVNVAGCFLIGLALELTEGRFVISPNAKLFVTIGLLGGFTTFSTYSYEALTLVRDGLWARASLYTVGSLLAGLAAAWMGVVAGRAL